MKEIVNILLDKIKDLELKVDYLERERRLVQNYLFSHNIVLTHYAEKLESILDDEEESIEE